MTAAEMVMLLWNKDINISELKGSIFMASIWDDDWDYGYEVYCEKYNNLTKEEYMQIIDFVQKYRIKEQDK